MPGIPTGILNFCPQQQKDQHIYDHYPQTPPAGACKLVPLYPTWMAGKYISQGEPGPAQFPVEMDIFEGQPEKDQGGVTGFFSSFSFYIIKADPGKAHQQGVRQDGSDTADKGGVQYPPGRCAIPDDQGEISPAEKFFPAGCLLFQP